MTKPDQQTLNQLFAARYNDAPSDVSAVLNHARLQTMAARGSCRSFKPDLIPDGWLDVICATAMAAPTKSDLQQRDIILIKSPEIRAQLAQLVSGQAWVADAPMIAVFCGNNRRQRLLHEWHDVPFSNDHLDAFFNAIGDAAIALGAFVTAAEALGLGCCPISAVRNKAAAVSELLGLPQHVFPFAGLAFGHPTAAPHISKRLPLKVTCHTDRYQETNLQDAVTGYDQDRAATQPYEKQRAPEQFGENPNYTWSMDKVRQYNSKERADFGAYVRKQGFKLD